MMAGVPPLRRAGLARIDRTGGVEARVRRPLFRLLDCRLALDGAELARFAVGPWRPGDGLTARRRLRLSHALLLGAAPTLTLEANGRALARLALGAPSTPLTLGHVERIDGPWIEGWAARRPALDDAELRVEIAGAPALRARPDMFRGDIFDALGVTRAGFRLRLPDPEDEVARSLRVLADGEGLPGGDLVWSAGARGLARRLAPFETGEALAATAPLAECAAFADWLEARPEVVGANPQSARAALLALLGVWTLLGAASVAADALARPTLRGLAGGGDGRMLAALRALLAGLAPVRAAALAGDLAAAAPGDSGLAVVALGCAARAGAATAAHMLAALAGDPGRPMHERLIAEEDAP